MRVSMLFVPIFLMFLISIIPSYAWEDRPDKEDHRKTDRLFKACQRITKANKYEIKLIERKIKENREKEFAKRSDKMKMRRQQKEIERTNLEDKPVTKEKQPWEK